jgi:uncharacterized protein
MQRLLLQELEKWRNAQKFDPILLRGARQVGKTYLVEQFARLHFKSFININFEYQPEFKQCFVQLDPEKILANITLWTRQKILPGETLLFLDEIQQCPQAIIALRYFKEKMPNLHVIGAGSLLEFTINDEQMRMPVGRVQSLYVRPISFREYLLAKEEDALIEILGQATIDAPPSEMIHEHLGQALREYFVLGGMPEVIADYLQHPDFLQVQTKQASIMNTYRNDFGKYAAKTKHKYMQKIFEITPSLTGQHIRYSKIDAHMYARDLKVAIQYLVDAGVIHTVYCSSASGLPLNAAMNEKKFKLIFLDIGLAKSTSYLDPNVMLSKDLMLINHGALVEQFVGQELLSIVPGFLPGELYYWAREKPGSQAEVDYVINIDDTILPVEVKSGKTGSLRSIHVFLKKKQLSLGIRLSLKPLALKDNILSVPLYMIHELPRLVRSCLLST